jgi:hypothetical protein
MGKCVTVRHASPHILRNGVIDEGMAPGKWISAVAAELISLQILFRRRRTTG